MNLQNYNDNKPYFTQIILFTTKIVTGLPLFTPRVGAFCNLIACIIMGTTRFFFINNVRLFAIFSTRLANWVTACTCFTNVNCGSTLVT